MSLVLKLFQDGFVSLLDMVGAIAKALVAAIAQDFKVFPIFRRVIEPHTNASLPLFRILLDAYPPIQPYFFHARARVWLICQSEHFYPQDCLSPRVARTESR